MQNVSNVQRGVRDIFFFFRHCAMWNEMYTSRTCDNEFDGDYL